MGAHRRLVSTLAKVVGYWHNIWQAQVRSWKEAKFYNQLLSLTMKNSTLVRCLPTKLCKSWHPSIMLMKINTPQKPNIPQGWLLTLKELERFGLQGFELICNAPNLFLSDLKFSLLPPDPGKIFWQGEFQNPRERESMTQGCAKVIHQEQVWIVWGSIVLKK